MKLSCRPFVQVLGLVACLIAWPASAAERRLMVEGQARDCCSEPRFGDDPSSGHRRMDRERMRQLRQDLRRDMDSSSSDEPPPRGRAWSSDDDRRGYRHGVGLRRLSPEERERMRDEIREAWRDGR